MSQLKENKKRQEDLHLPDFIILSGQRTGSNMLKELLNSHRSLNCYGELFVKNQNVAKDEMNGLPKAFFERFYDYQIRKKRYKAFIKGVGKRQDSKWGFKFMNNQLRWAREYIIKHEKSRPILLRRMNILAVYSSELTAKKTGVGVVMEGQSYKSVKVFFNKSEFLEFKSRHERRYDLVVEMLEFHKKNFYQVQYEDLIGKKKPKLMHEMQDFLGVSFMPLRTKTIMRNPGKVIDRFSNPDEVTRFISTIGKEHWLL